MNAHGQTFGLESPRPLDLPTDTPEPTPLFQGGIVSRLGLGPMRRLRLAAWRVLDLETEFEPLD